MRKIISIIAVIAMLVPAVQGYAQGPRREGGHRSVPSQSHSAPSRSSSPSRSSAPSRSYSAPSRSSAPRQSYTAPSRSSAPRQSYSTPSRSTSRPSVTTQQRSTTPRQSATAPTRTAPQRQGVTTTPRNSAPRQNGTVTRSAPPRSNAPRQSSPGYNNPGGHRHATPPPPRHHSGHHHHHHGYLSHGHHHHHHHCIWDTWRYYSYGGYHNRFICHSYYRDRYFDSLLGYYLYGSFDSPTRLEIGGLSLTRYNGQLQIQNGSSYSYMNLWQSQTVRYVSGYTTIEITTGNGYAYIYFYDSYGNEATYQL